MKRSIIAAGLLTAAIASAAAAQADTSQLDTQFVACVSTVGIYNPYGVGALASTGREIVVDISSGTRNPLQEANFMYATSPRLSQRDANAMVNCATSVYLGYGSDGTSATRVS